MLASPREEGLQELCCAALSNVCAGTDAAALTRKQRAADAGAIEAAVAAMQAHPQVVVVPLLSANVAADMEDMARSRASGCEALCNVCSGTDAAALARKQRAADAGAIEAAVAAMQAHPQVVGVQLPSANVAMDMGYAMAMLRASGCEALGNVCSGSDAAGLARKQRAADAGAIEAAVAAMQAHPQEAGVQENCCAALSNVCSGSDAAGLARKQRAAAAGAIEAAAVAMQAHPKAACVQAHGQCLRALLG